METTMSKEKRNFVITTALKMAIPIILILVLSIDFKQVSADRYFNGLAQAPGFTKLYNKNFPEQMRARNTFAIMKQNSVVQANKSNGYTIQKTAFTDQGTFNSHDTVKLYDLNGNFISNADWEGLWTNGIGTNYHIVMVSSPKDWTYQQEYYIEADKIVVRHN